MLKKSILSSLFAIMLIMLHGCSKDETKNQNKISSNEYTLTSIQNKQITIVQTDEGFRLKNKKNKIVIFDIFATWCPPCRKAVSHLSSIQKKYKKDVIIIGLTIEDNIDNLKLKEFKKTYKANYILVNSDQNRLLSDKITNNLKLGNRYPIPVIAIYKDGKYINHYIGSIEEEFIDSDIKRALGK